MVELNHVLDEAAIEKASLDLLETAAQSQAGLERATRWLAAIGEEVFAAFEMRLGPAELRLETRRG